VPESLVQQHDKDSIARVMVVLNNSSPLSPAIKIYVVYIVVTDPPLDQNASCL